MRNLISSDLPVKRKLLFLNAIVTAGTLLLFAFLLVVALYLIGGIGLSVDYRILIGALVFFFIVSLGTALFAANYLQRSITEPLALLADSVRIITELGDYSIRVNLFSTDEIGALASDFNSMFETLQLRDELLNEFHENLAELVLRRTEEALAERERVEILESNGNNMDNSDSDKQSKIPLSRLVEKHMGELASKAKLPLANEKIGGKVLVVDDELISRQILKGILHQVGLESVDAANGAEAVRMIEAEFYPIILMDIQMPEMNGYQATNMIRAMEKSSARKRAKVVAVTASDKEDTHRKCLEVGMDDCLIKPVSTDLLNQKIAALFSDDHKTVKEKKKLSSDSSTAESTSEIVQESENLQQEELWSKSRALELVGGDEDLFCEIATVFLDRNELLVKNIERAVEHGDADDLLETAHAYKGAVGHFAASGLRRSALALENLARQGTVAGVDGHLAALQENSVLLCQELLLFVSDVRGR